MDIELKITVDLTSSLILRREPTLGAEAAKRLAVELHDIVAEYRRLFPLHRRDDAPEIEETDVIVTILQSAVAYPSDETPSDCGWLMGMLTLDDDHGDDGLYVRYLKVFDTIQKTDLAYVATDSEQPPARTQPEILH